MNEYFNDIKQQYVEQTGVSWPKKPSLHRINEENIARYIDHTNLKLDVDNGKIQTLCEEAMTHEFFSVCIPLIFVPHTHTLLENTPVKICTVIGFPFGYLPTSSKVEETRYALSEGAEEVDMVVCVGDVKQGLYMRVFDDIATVKEICGDRCVKVILECSELTDEEKIRVATIAMLAGADFVKTSTGFASGGATLDDISLLRSVVGEIGAVKASGGIRDISFALACKEAGADRIGSSSGLRIIEQQKDL